MKKMIIILWIILAMIISMTAFSTAAENNTLNQIEEVTLTNINTASITQLRALPGIGESNSLRIIAGRPYTNKEQLISKKVIRISNYNKIKNMITAGRSND